MRGKRLAAALVTASSSYTSSSLTAGGRVREEELQDLVDATIRLEVRFRAEALANTLAFRSGHEMNLTLDEIASLNRAFDRLSGLLEELPLPEDERAAVRKAFPPQSTTDQPPASRVVAKEFVIRGVFRGPTEEEVQAGIEVPRECSSRS